MVCYRTYEICNFFTINLFLYIEIFLLFNNPFLLFWFFDTDLLVIRTDGILFFIFGSFLAIKGFKLELFKIESKVVCHLLFLVWILILSIMTYLNIKGFLINILTKFLYFWSIYDLGQLRFYYPEKVDRR